MTTLIVTLAPPAAGASTDPVEYSYLLTPDGRTMGAHATAAAALLPAPTGEVVAVVPVRTLSWHQVDLPRGAMASTTRLRAVLEGLLEERLLDDPETLHFALEPGARAGASAWVAVCDRAWLRGRVHALEAAGRRVMRIVPEFAPDVVGTGDTTLHVIGEPQDAWLVTTHSGGVIALPLSPSTLPMAQVAPRVPDEAAMNSAVRGTSADDTHVIAEPSVAAMAEQLLGRKVTIRQNAERQLLAAQSSWDLAQFDLASTGGLRAAKKFAALWRELLAAPRWRPARWGVGLLLAANLLGLNAWAFKEESALAAKRGQLRGILAQTFPAVKVVVDAPLQMEREVTLLRQATGAVSGSDIESILSAVSAVDPAGKPLQDIEFSSGEARLKGLFSGGGDASAIISGLRSLGYAARAEGEALIVRQEVQK